MTAIIWSTKGKHSLHQKEKPYYPNMPKPASTTKIAVVANTEVESQIKWICKGEHGFEQMSEAMSSKMELVPLNPSSIKPICRWASFDYEEKMVWRGSYMQTKCLVCIPSEWDSARKARRKLHKPNWFDYMKAWIYTLRMWLLVSRPWETIGLPYGFLVQLSFPYLHQLNNLFIYNYNLGGLYLMFPP